MATMTGLSVEEWTDTTTRSWTRVLTTRACPRCGGLLVRDPFADILEDGAPRDLAARRCVQCGEVVDPIILMNRSSRRSGTVEADRRALALQGSAERS